VTAGSDLPAASGNAHTKAKPHATEPRPAQWDGIHRCAPRQGVGFRQRLLATTQYNNLIAWAADVAGWDMIAEAVASISASGQPPLPGLCHRSTSWPGLGGLSWA
jgi:hypothetical protein